MHHYFPWGLLRTLHPLERVNKTSLDKTSLQDLQFQKLGMCGNLANFDRVRFAQVRSGSDMFTMS